MGGKMSEENLKNNQEFKRLFDKLEKYLNNLVKDNITSLPLLIKTACDKEPFIRNFSSELNDFSLIRTLIAHKGRIEIVKILDETLDNLKRVYNLITNPPTIYDKFKKDVFICQTSEPLLDVLKLMKEKTYTHIPVYEDNKFIGILSEASFTNWATEKENINLIYIKVKDLVNYLNNQSNEFFEFVKKSENAFEVRGWFYNKVKEHKRLGAVFITETGNKEEPLLGIVTAWDLTELELSKQNNKEAE